MSKDGVVIGHLNESQAGSGIFISQGGLPIGTLIKAIDLAGVTGSNTALQYLEVENGFEFLSGGNQQGYAIKSTFVPPFDSVMNSAITPFGLTQSDFQGTFIRLIPNGDSYRIQLELGNSSSSAFKTFLRSLGYVGQDPLELAKQAQALQIMERLRNGMLRYGYRTEQEIAAHKLAQIQKIKDNPTKTYIILAQTDALSSFMIRHSTGDLLSSLSFNHSALYYGTGDVLHIDLNAHLRNNNNTDLENLPLDTWASRYKDIEVIEVQLTEEQIQSQLQTRIYTAYVNQETETPIKDVHYDGLEAIGGYLAPQFFNINTCKEEFICTSLINQIFIEAFEKGLIDSLFITPNDFDRRKNEQGIIVP